MLWDCVSILGPALCFALTCLVWPWFVYIGSPLVSQFPAAAQLLRGGPSRRSSVHLEARIHLIQTVYVPVTGVCVTLRHCHNSYADIPAMFAAPLSSLLIGYRRAGWERRSSEDPQALSLLLLRSADRFFRAWQIFLDRSLRSFELLCFNTFWNLLDFYFFHFFHFFYFLEFSNSEKTSIL